MKYLISAPVALIFLLVLSAVALLFPNFPETGRRTSPAVVEFIPCDIDRVESALSAFDKIPDEHPGKIASAPDFAWVVMDSVRNCDPATLPNHLRWRVEDWISRFPEIADEFRRP